MYLSSETMGEEGAEKDDPGGGKEDTKVERPVVGGVPDYPNLFPEEKY